MGAALPLRRHPADTGVVGVYVPDTSTWTVNEYQAALEEARRISLYWIQLSAAQNTELRKLDLAIPPRMFHPEHPFAPFATRFRSIVKKRADPGAAKIYAGQVIDHIIYMIQNNRSEVPFRSNDDLVQWMESRKHTTA